MRRRSGEAKAEVLELTEQTGRLLAKSVKEARTLAADRRRRARGRGARAKLKAARKLEELADRCEKVSSRSVKRVAGEKITDRLMSLWDPDARPIRKGKLAQPNQFGYVDQLCEITANTKPRRARVHPAATQPDRQPGREHAAARHRRELQNLGITLKEVMVDGGFNANPDEHRARGPGRRDPHHRPPGARVTAHPPPPTALPHRRRRPDQPPQTRLRAAPIAPQRRRRPPDLGRLGDLHLQRRHLHHPPVRKQPFNRGGSGQETARKRPKG